MKTYQVVLTLLATSFMASCGPISESQMNNDSYQGLLNAKPVVERNTAASKSVVLLERVSATGSLLGFCSGTLVAPNTVLTAGHCFDHPQNNKLVRYQVAFTNSLFSSNNDLRRPVVGYSLHHYYNRRKIYDHDIAVLVFQGTTPAGFAPVAIDRDTKADYSNSLVYVYGFGLTKEPDGKNHLQDAGKLHRGIMLVAANYNRYPDRYLTQMTSESFICGGDSGGPQFHHEKGVLKLVGINSANLAHRRLPSGEFSCKAVAQITKVSAFAKWIDKEEQALRKKYLR